MWDLIVAVPDPYLFTLLTKYLENCLSEDHDTPQPLYNTIVGVQANFRVSYPIRVISRVKCIDYIRKGVLNSHLGSNPNPCYIQNRVITNRVIKRFRCIKQIVLIHDVDDLVNFS